MTMSGLSAAIFSMSGCIAPTFGSACAAAGKFEASSAPATLCSAPTANIISVRFGASVTTRAGFGCGRGGAGRSASHPRRQTKTAAEAAARIQRVRRSLRLTALLVIEIVGHAQASAGRGVHLLGSVDGGLQLGNPVLHLGQLFLDGVLEIVDLLFGHAERGLVKLALLVCQNGH